MGRRSAIAACLVFSGLAALVHQIIWVRLLGSAALLLRPTLRRDNGLPLLPALSADAIPSQPTPCPQGDGTAATATR